MATQQSERRQVQVPALRRSAAYDTARAQGRDTAKDLISGILAQHEAMDALAGNETSTARLIEAALSEAAATAARVALDRIEDDAERIGFLCDLCTRVQRQPGNCPDCLGTARRLVVAWEPCQ